jgi:hypothetical protein
MSDIGTTIISAGAVSMLILQFIIKPLLRKFWLGANFDFSPQVYVLMITVLNVLVALPLALLEIEGYVMPSDWMQWGKATMVIILQALITFGSYDVTIKPMRDYAEELKNGE